MASRVQAPPPPAVQPAAQNAPVVQSPVAHSRWGFSSLSCCSPVGCIRRVVAFIQHQWHRLTEWFRSFAAEEEDEERPAEQRQIPAPVAQLTAAEFVARYSDGRAIDRASWERDCMALHPTAVSVAVNRIFVDRMQARFGELVPAYRMVLKSFVGDPGALEALGEVDEDEHEEVVEEAPKVPKSRQPTEEERLRKFVADWNRLSKNPPQKPNDAASDREKQRFSVLCNSWCEALNGLPDLPGQEIVMFIQGRLTRIGRALPMNETANEVFKEFLANRVIVAIVKDHLAAAKLRAKQK